MFSKCYVLEIDDKPFSATEEERDDWTTEIRGGKTQLFVSLNVTNPNSTSTSSASTNHIRRSLQALPFPPPDDRLGTLRASSSLDVIGVSLSLNDGKGRKKNKEKHGHSVERRRKVDHWVPAIWIPDEKTSSCMRCGRSFGWRRRRHHCRLCGRCICASCSGRVSPFDYYTFPTHPIAVPL
jgi:FYVE/RhoGEF/PH domain-containing protein 5/6